MSLKSFTDYLLLEKKYSKLTVKAYQNDLESFNTFISEEYNQSSIKNVNYPQIRNWIVSLVEKKISNRSINRKVSSLNSYFKFLLKVGDVQSNPLAKHQSFKNQ